MNIQSQNTMSDHFDQLERQRSPYLLKSLILQDPQRMQSQDWKFFISKNDTGVILNRGRQGAKDGGRVIWQHLINFTKPHNFSSKLYPCYIDSEIAKSEWCSKGIHLGSGHDHVFHLLNFALKNRIKNFLILNFDAHADMRQDNLLHSGTPFRFFFNQHKKEIEHYQLQQIGLNIFHQNPQDLELAGAKVEVFWSKESGFDRIKQSLEKIKQLFENFSKDETLIVVSIDADVFSGSAMPAVSAVNPTGLEVTLVANILSEIKKEFSSYQKILGIYEYNPLYDDISAKGAKTLAALIYEWMV